MSIFNKKIGLSALLAIVVLSLALAAILPALAANGAEVYFTITVASNDDSMGTVSIVGTNPHSTEANKYKQGTNVTLQATAKNETFYKPYQSPSFPRAPMQAVISRVGYNRLPPPYLHRR